MNKVNVLNYIGLKLGKIPNKNIIKKVEGILFQNNYNLSIFKVALIFEATSKYENILPKTKSIVEINRINIIKNIFQIK